MPDAAGTTLAFPVVQKCGSAQNAWVEPMNADGSEPEHPAPTVKIVAATTDDHDHAEATETTVATDDSSADRTTTTAVDVGEGSGDDGGSSGTVLGVIAIVVAGVSLAVGVAGLAKKR
jgi:hypothetical protein